MIVLFIILGVLALPFLIALFVSKDMNFSKTIEINSTAEKVWPLVNSLGAMDKWSPWNSKDPNMKRSLTGQDGTPGACQSWVSSNKQVGEGSQTIIKLTPNKRMDTRLDFIKPFKSTAAAFVILDEKGGKTATTWGFESQMAYPMNIMKLFMNMEKSMDKEFGAGLTKLKEIAEN